LIDSRLTTESMIGVGSSESGIPSPSVSMNGTVVVGRAAEVDGAAVDGATVDGAAGPAVVDGASATGSVVVVDEPGVATDEAVTAVVVG